MKKILFLSKDNLTTNPRLQKELKLAIKMGYKVDFVGFYSANWSDEVDEKIRKNLNANFTYISATRKPFLKWFISTIREKIAQKTYRFSTNNLKINAFAHNKRTILLQKYLKKNQKKYDLIVAHTLPTLFPAYIVAKKQNTPFTFDIEDYHPGEQISLDTKNETARRKFLVQKILPKASYITYASPLIGEYCLKLLVEHPAPSYHQLINNCFSQDEFKFTDNNSEKIKFVWFSQNINQGRGLEVILPALYQFKNEIEIILIGNLYQEFYAHFLSKYSDFIKIIPPLPQKELNLKLSKFDVGLAIELLSADFNRNICLTNKIFAYAQAGLFVFATDTKAQKQFLAENKNIGLIIEQENKNITEKVKFIIDNISEIRENKKQRFAIAKQMSWENESKKIIDIWNKILQ